MIGDGGRFDASSRRFLIASRAGRAVSGSSLSTSCGRGSSGSTTTGVTTTRSSLSLFCHCVLENSCADYRQVLQEAEFRCATSLLLVVEQAGDDHALVAAARPLSSRLGAYGMREYGSRRS